MELWSSSGFDPELGAFSHKEEIKGDSLREGRAITLWLRKFPKVVTSVYLNLYTVVILKMVCGFPRPELLSCIPLNSLKLQGPCKLHLECFLSCLVLISSVRRNKPFNKHVYTTLPAFIRILRPLIEIFISRSLLSIQQPLTCCGF